MSRCQDEEGEDGGGGQRAAEQIQDSRGKLVDVGNLLITTSDISVAQCFILELLFLSLNIEQLQEVKASFYIE